MWSGEEGRAGGWSGQHGQRATRQCRRGTRTQPWSREGGTVLLSAQPKAVVSVSVWARSQASEGLPWHSGEALEGYQAWLQEAQLSYESFIQTLRPCGPPTPVPSPGTLAHQSCAVGPI